MLSEFDLIAKYFTRPTRHATLGVGDDCALLTPTPGMQTAISCDMLVSGTHFFADTDPKLLGHKSLAVNLSDLAAMGAKPVAFTLALALPKADEPWLAAFADGMLALADLHGCELIGGDTTRGPLNICITVFGEVPVGQALQRSAAQVGDDIWVSGSLGDARLGLAGLRKEVALDQETLSAALTRLQQPMPRVALGIALRGVAHAAIDVSDGLIGDLGHILDRSGVGASLNVDLLPFGPMLAEQPQDIQRRFALAGGDDYELCFTAPTAARSAVVNAGNQTGKAVTRIGRIEAAAGLRLQDAAGQPVALDVASFDHFGAS
ncbi:MAG: thiamine-phosphate kinase [Burkholderiaceae bacterium]|nr:thiamine-phosphate kinase [Burkholderiaceae bacterium]